MAGIRIASLPATADTVLRPLVMDDPADGPHHEVAGVRVRRTPSFLHLEGPMEVGGWCNWYVDITLGLQQRASLVNMHQTMLMSRALARRAPRSAAATIAEKAAPNATALARHYSAKVGGVDTAVLHLPYADYDRQQAKSLGLALEEAALVTLLIVTYPSPLGELVDAGWVQRSALAVETGWTLLQEVSALEEEIASQGPGAHQRLLASPTGNWVDRVGGAVDVVNSIGDIVGAVAKVAKTLAGP